MEEASRGLTGYYPPKDLSVLNERQRKIALEHTIFFVPGKCKGKYVDVVFEKSYDYILRGLMDSTNRQRAGVPKDDNFVFARTRDGVVSCWHALEKIRVNSGADSNIHINATHMWHYAANVEKAAPFT